VWLKELRTVRQEPHDGQEEILERSREEVKRGVKEVLEVAPFSMGMKNLNL